MSRKACVVVTIVQRIGRSYHKTQDTRFTSMQLASKRSPTIMTLWRFVAVLAQLVLLTQRHALCHIGCGTSSLHVHRTSPAAVERRKEHLLPLLFKKYRPLRNADFWGRAARIYGSYKWHQLRQLMKHGVKLKEVPVEKLEEEWSPVHELNSQRMIEMCLGLRGFYLKTGQFLGTRHDFMPTHYTTKLTRLQDDVPPLGEEEIREVIEKEMNGSIEDHFTFLDLTKPIGSASVAQVHVGNWRKTGEKVALKIQYPNAEKVMMGDLRNIRILAELLQRTELKFDVLSAVKELQKQIKNEFDFDREGKNMDMIRLGMAKGMPEIEIPRKIWSSKRALVMTFVEGENLSRLAEYKDNSWGFNMISKRYKQKVGRRLLDKLAKAWGYQMFVLRAFNADPHPGNICMKKGGKIGLLDWGQIKYMGDTLAEKYSAMIEAIAAGERSQIVAAFKDLGVRVMNEDDEKSIQNIAVTMLDTRVVPGYVMDPFNPKNSIKDNPVKKLPADLYFVVRTVQLLRGIAHAFEVDYSVADAWRPHARKILAEAKTTKR